jgi:hypothetical protein
MDNHIRALAAACSEHWIHRIGPIGWPPELLTVEAEAPPDQFTGNLQGSVGFTAHLSRGWHRLEANNMSLVEPTRITGLSASVYETDLIGPLPGGRGSASRKVWSRTYAMDEVPGSSSHRFVREVRCRVRCGGMM